MATGGGFHDPYAGARAPGPPGQHVCSRMGAFRDLGRSVRAVRPFGICVPADTLQPRLARSLYASPRHVDASVARGTAVERRPRLDRRCRIRADLQEIEPALPPTLRS